MGASGIDHRQVDCIGLLKEEKRQVNKKKKKKKKNKEQKKQKNKKKKSMKIKRLCFALA